MNKVEDTGIEVHSGEEHDDLTDRTEQHLDDQKMDNSDIGSKSHEGMIFVIKLGHSSLN